MYSIILHLKPVTYAHLAAHLSIVGFLSLIGTKFLILLKNSGASLRRILHKLPAFHNLGVE